MQHSYSWGFGLQGQRIPYWKRLLLQNAAPRGPAEGGLSILLNSEMLSKQSLCSGLGEAHRLEVLDCSLGSRPPQVPGLGCTVNPCELEMVPSLLPWLSLAHEQVS